MSYEPMNPWMKNVPISLSDHTEPCKTNFDRITENPDKLAEFLRANLKDCYHCPADTPGCGENCKQAWINWLNLGVSK